MTHQNDSFIDEVTEDLRRDRLFAAFRRYGWIGLLVILAIVAGAAWREYSAITGQRDAQAFGDALIAADRADDRAAALAAVPVDDAGQRALIALLTAAAQVEAGDDGAAAATLDTVDGDGAVPQVVRDLAGVKLVALHGAAMDPAVRDAMLSDLSQAGRPFRLLALEQQAVALVAADRIDDAVALIRRIQQEQGLTAEQARRLAEMLITLGAEDAQADDAAAPPGPADAPGAMLAD